MLPKLDAAFRAKFRARAEHFKAERAAMVAENPYGVPITRTGWAGNSAVVGMATTNYWLHKAFPDLFGIEDTLQGLNYLYGTHPDTNLSFVSAVGTQSKQVAYGNNRADFSFIAGGVVPGVLVLKPDFPENKEDWPFLWGENEYVIDLGARYVFLGERRAVPARPGRQALTQATRRPAASPSGRWNSTRCGRCRMKPWP